MRLALAEDIGQGDITANLTPGDALAAAVVIVKDDAMICGIDWFEAAFRQLDSAVSFRWKCHDGDRLKANDEVCRLDGRARAILSGERTALNFLQTLSATATAADAFVSAIAGTRARILDTRKTLPGLRSAQKYAVQCGGAFNHRFGLFDAILIKENHIHVLGSLDAAIERSAAYSGSTLIEIEVETIEQAERALHSHADRLLLDNFSLDMLHEAIALRDRIAPAKELEASGGITLENVRDVAETGVDYISIGDMTKSVSAVDFSLRVIDDVD